MSERESIVETRAQAGSAGPTFDSPRRTAGRALPAPPAEAIDRFVALSSALTGYDDAHLRGTGMVGVYIGFAWRAVGPKVMGALLSVWNDIATEVGALDGTPAADAHKADDVNDAPGPNDVAEGERLTPTEIAVRSRILLNDTLGPVARNLVVLWYLGQWNQMPADWRDVHGANAVDMTGFVSAEAYAQGLVWEAIGSHPQGAKMPGYGSWALPPKQLEHGA